MPFGLYYENEENQSSYGIMVKLIDVVKRYPGGELDVQIEGDYFFRLDTFYPKFQKKQYAGGVVSRLSSKVNSELSEQNLKQLAEFVRLRDSETISEVPRNMWDAAMELSLSSQDKYELIRLDTMENQQSLLRSHIQLRKAIIEQEKQQEFNINMN